MEAPQLYDAYVVVSPYQGTPILIASPAVNYVERYSSGESCEIPLTLAYNPLGFYSQTGGHILHNLWTCPIHGFNFYRDASGYSQRFQQFNNGNC
jgi:hypothetical protein